MISKQDFLKIVEKEIFPILRLHQEKVNKYMRFCKMVPIIAFFGAIFLAFLYAYLSGRNARSWVFGILLPSPVIITACVWIAAARCCERVKDTVKPKLFKILDLDENSTDDPLEELSDIGIFPYFNNEYIDDTFAVLGTQHSLFVQEVDLEKSSGKHSTNLFSGAIIRANQLHPKPFSLLILDSKSKKNRSQKELTNKFFAKLSGVKFQWQKVEDKFLNKDFSFYTDNQELCEKYLTSSLLSVIEKLKSGDKEPLNILFHDEKIFLAVSSERDLFECINWKDFSDTEPYAQLYDDVQSLHRVDELLLELEECH